MPVDTALSATDMLDPRWNDLGRYWIEQSQSAIGSVPTNFEYPRISIVTPSYNQGQFLEETILSILWQGYPNLEYIVIDGGSTDNSVEIIKKYEKYITYWVSEPDRGQTHAINKGFARCTGNILAWLNSDDLYMPGTLHRVAQLFSKHQKVDVLTGAWIGYEQASGNIFCTRACGVGLHPTMAVMLAQRAYLGQHSTFWRKQVWEAVGPLKEELYYAMDHDFFLRCCDRGFNFKLTAAPLAVFRLHANQKTNAYAKYTAESKSCMAEYENRPEWQSPLGRFKIRMAQKLIALGHHRNKHPRLGLTPRFNREEALRWFNDLREQKA